MVIRRWDFRMTRPLITFVCAPTVAPLKSPCWPIFRHGGENRRPRRLWVLCSCFLSHSSTSWVWNYFCNSCACERRVFDANGQCYGRPVLILCSGQPVRSDACVQRRTIRNSMRGKYKRISTTRSRRRGRNSLCRKRNGSQMGRRRRNQCFGLCRN